MARLWTSGAELQTATIGIEFTAVSGSTGPAIETTTKRSGNAAFRINSAAAEGFRNLSISAQGAYFFRFYLYIVALPTGGTKLVGGFMTTGTTRKVSIRMTTGGALQLYNSEDAAQIGSDSAALSTATWYRIEVGIDSTTLSATTAEAKINGTTFANGTIDLAVNPTSVWCGHDGDAAMDYIVDDLAFNDASGSFQNTWPGEGEVIVLRPNGNGDNNAWVGSDADSTDNYLLVDEVPPSSTDYVESNTSGQIDDYNLEATPAAMDSSDVINVVHVGVYAAVSDATSADPDIVLRIKASASGTVEESANLDVNSVTFAAPYPLPHLSDDNYKLTLYDLPGASTTAWTKADLDQAQAGIREAVTDAHLARVAALWVTVDHKPGTGNAYTLTAAAGSYGLTGNTAGLLWKHVMAAVSGTYALTGNAVAFALAHKISAEAGVYALTGNAITFPRTYILVGSAGSYVLTGNAASLLFKRLLVAGAGTYILTGNNVILIYSGDELVHYTIAADTGSYALTGNSASLLFKRVLSALAGSYVLNGNNISFLFNHVMPAGIGSYILTGRSVALVYSNAPIAVAHYIYIIPAEGRVFLIPAEVEETIADRTFVISEESRAYQVTHD